MRFKETAVLFIFLIIIAAMGLIGIYKKTPTYDESFHLDYGNAILNHKPERDPNNDSKMPISALNALPERLAQSWGWQESFSKNMSYARAVTVLFSLLLAFYVFRWSKELYGTFAAFISLTLYTFSPTILAHSRVVTTDLYAALFYTLSLYYFWKFLKRPSLGTFFASSVTLGVAQLTKYNCVFLYPLFIMIAVVRYWDSIVELISQRKIKTLGNGVTKSALIGVFFIAVNLFIINAGFLFNKTGTPFGKYEFKSPLFRNLQRELTWLNPVPVPAPYPFLQGIDMTWESRKHHLTRNYLMGQIAPKDHGFTGYYLYAFMLKVPIAIQILILAALISYLRKRKKFSFKRDESFMLIPVAALFLFMNLVDKRNIGIRHILMLFPLLFVFMGSLYKGKGWSGLGIYKKAGTALLIAYLIASNLSYFPHYLSYFNEIVWDRKMSYKYLVDSNLDWGQNVHYLERYLKKHPDAKFRPDAPVSGLVVVGANELVGVWDPERYRWLRETLKPVGHIAYSYLVFNVPEESLMGLKMHYYKLNKEELKSAIALQRLIAYKKLLIKSGRVKNGTLERASVLESLGNKHLELARYMDRDKNLKKAADSYRRAAQNIIAIEKNSLRLARINKKLGDSYAYLTPAGRNERSLNRALSSYYEAMTAYTQESYPREYAQLQYKIGNVYRMLANERLRASQDLKLAVKAYKKALSAGAAHEGSIIDESKAWNSLALTYALLAQKGQREVNCKKALEAYSAAQMGKTNGEGARKKRRRTLEDEDVEGELKEALSVCGNR